MPATKEHAFRIQEGSPRMALTALKDSLVFPMPRLTARRPSAPLFASSMARHLSDSSVSSNDATLRYVCAEKNDYDQILRFTMDHFRRNEPISLAVGLTEVEGLSFIPSMVQKSLEKSISTKVLNDDDELVAVMLASIIERSPAKKNSTIGASTELTGGAAKICAFLDHMEKDLWDLVPKHYRNLIKIEIISVRADYTRKGIANKLINIDREIMKKFDCQGFVSVATAFNSQKLFLKNGFEAISTTKHTDWLDANGQPVFKCQDKTDSAMLVFKCGLL